MLPLVVSPLYSDGRIKTALQDGASTEKRNYILHFHYKYFSVGINNSIK